VRVAAIDCGTNTIRLLVTDLEPGGGQRDLVREMRFVRLGQDVDRTGRLGEEALTRTFAAIDEYAAIIADHGAAAVRFCATSAARDAANADDFAAGVEARLGVVPEVIDGSEEARLSFDGATRMLLEEPRPVLVVDIGGGSTELIIGDAAGSVTASCSLDIGSVRLTERLLPSDPPTSTELAAATVAIDEALDTLPSHGVHVEDAATLVGVAGTVTTVAAVALGIDDWERDRVHLAKLDRADMHAVSGLLLGATVDEREALRVPAGRSDVIGAGALILDRVLHRASVEALLVSDSDILDGIAWSLAP
jgi:exopolyphosphatase/guanosine-5'-triphosphate,3'-diphosphate pyrophosphatase